MKHFRSVYKERRNVTDIDDGRYKWIKTLKVITKRFCFDKYVKYQMWKTSAKATNMK